MGDPLLKDLRSMLGSGVRTGWERKSIGFDKEQEYLELILRDVVIGDPETGAKRSNSLIIYGRPGSGKTAFVENALTKLAYQDEFRDSRIVVRLSGLLCPDFRSAVDSICWQLHYRRSSGEEEGNNDIFNDLEFGGNFDARLEQTIAVLQTSIEAAKKSVIFILDKLDRFAEHWNQGLLYTLLDLAANSQSSVPICIIGVTYRVDVLEMFEKRVKSRFSHRHIHLDPKYDFVKYKEIAKRLLSFPITPNGYIDQVCRKWNDSIGPLFDEIKIQQILQSIFDTDNTILQLTSFLYSVCIMAKDNITLTEFEKAFEDNFKCQDHVKVALDLPISELLVLLSAYKHFQTNKQQAWQPGKLYKIVENIMNSLSLGKEDYFQAVTKLEALQLIVPVSTAHRNVGGVNNVGEVYFKCELSYSEFQDIWKRYPQLPSSFAEFL